MERENQVTEATDVSREVLPSYALQHYQMTDTELRHIALNLAASMNPTTGHDMVKHAEVIYAYLRSPIQGGSVQGADFTQSFAAQDWANAFQKIIVEAGVQIDAELMLGWFANALMRGYDERVWQDRLEKGPRTETAVDG